MHADAQQHGEERACACAASIEAIAVISTWCHVGAQVESGMVESVRDVCAASIAAYTQRPHASWVLEWPGQAVLVAAATHWTANLTAAMTLPNPGIGV